MTSLIIIAPVGELQNKINSVLKSFRGAPVIYVTLNKSPERIEDNLEKARINTDKTFFIDCVSSEKTRDDVVYIAPTDLHLLACAIDAFMKDIPGEEFLVIDALSTLLIYNKINKVAKFVKEITGYSSRYQTKIIAFTAETKGEELSNKVFHFFDKVEKK